MHYTQEGFNNLGCFQTNVHTQKTQWPCIILCYIALCACVCVSMCVSLFVGAEEECGRCRRVRERRSHAEGSSEMSFCLSSRDDFRAPALFSYLALHQPKAPPEILAPVIKQQNELSNSKKQEISYVLFH